METEEEASNVMKMSGDARFYTQYEGEYSKTGRALKETERRQKAHLE